jgi:hypothetical protein
MVRAARRAGHETHTFLDVRRKGVHICARIRKHSISRRHEPRALLGIRLGCATSGSTVSRATVQVWRDWCTMYPDTHAAMGCA